MPPIRMRYAGLIGFVTRILSIFTGFLFIIIVTRRLSEADFGTWVWISRLIGYTVFPTVAISFWATRFIARGFQAAKTSIVLSLLISTAATLVYLVISPFAAEASDAPLIFFLLASIQVPLAYTNENLDGIAKGTKPQVMSYGLLAYETIKVVLAFLFMTFLGRTLSSAIFAVAGAQIIGVITLLLFLRGHLFYGFDKGMAWRWLRAAWIPLYSGLALIMITFDTSVIIGFTGSSLILANYGAAYVFYSVVMAASALSVALYPKLLQGGDHKDVTGIINLTALFAIPITAGALIITRPLLYLLNPVYADAILAARAIILFAFLFVFAGLFDFVILGTEKVELKVDSKFKDFVRSRLFLLPSINLLYGIAYLVVLAIVTNVTLSMNIGPETTAFYWALTQLLTFIPFFLYKWLLAKRSVDFKVPWRSLSLYLIAAAAMVVTLQLLKLDISYTPSIYAFVDDAAQLVTVGAAIYFAILYVFDPYFRDLLRTIWRSMRP